MLNFVTLFDINFINQGIVLYNSLIDKCKSFKLHVVCFDDNTFDILKNLNYINLIPVNLKELESEYGKLREKKVDRKIGEYCWTSTPFVIKYCLEKLKLPFVIYLDADLYFLQSPDRILDFIPDNKNVIITKHNYSKNLEHLEKTSGKYCVQFMYFNQEDSSLFVLNKWADQCIDWCYNYYDVINDRFGDQKYLDDWEKYDNVHVVENICSAAGPWNIDQIILHKNFNDVIFYHFHDFKIKNTGIIDFERLLTVYKKSDIFFYNLYINYISNILLVNDDLYKKFNIKKIKFCYLWLIKILFKNEKLLVKIRSILKRIIR